ncbi:Eco57I restriction-modification methylase domain-containing protein [Pontibacillus salicampi]|uniref:site-specific DNA-methyltransferase (adenine-specific) n=1 Tax=Pontibacillus salicampi TaxID=1449801 RepID=A0ABV6LUI1_9BACI
MKNSGFISEAYLKKVIKKTSVKELEVLLETIKSWFNDIKEEVLNNVSEDDMSFGEYLYDFIAPILSSLNFTYQKLDDIHELLLFCDSNKSQKVATLYAIRFDKNLNTETKGLNYSFNAVQLAKRNNIRWAFLTNGFKWRIYDTHSNSPYENFLEVNLEQVLYNKLDKKDINALLLTNFFQGKVFFKEKDQSSIIENHFISSEKEVEKQEKTLKNKMEEVVKHICYGFKESIGKDNFTSQEKKDIFEDAIVLLYRILFIHYAESRELLPFDNPIYKDQSLTTLTNNTRDFFNNGEITSIAHESTLWRKFDRLRNYVDEGWEDINMSAYNGGLFDNSERPILRNYSIKNSYFSTVLCELSYFKKSDKYTDRIEYKDLSVRNLGSLYEGLLEFNLFIANEQLVRRKDSKGKINFIEVSETQLKRNEQLNLIEPGDIYLANDATERKSTGSYYTPEDVVNYIIKNTIGEKLESIVSEFNDNLNKFNEKLLITVTESEKNAVQKEIDVFTLSFIKKNILSLSIIDSSMGSGHFLVNSTYYITNCIMELINSTTWVNSDIPANYSYWKSMVVSNCIYGIDINPLAVHLGKLSLWLISAEKNKPLSFMDHHLKTGNSLMGISKKQIENKIEEWTNDEYNLFTSLYNNSLNSAIDKYEQLQSLPEETKDDVHYKKELYENISSELEIMKKKYDLFLSYLIKDGEINEEIYLEKLSLNDIKSIFEGINQEDNLKKLSDKNKFFHWELEYPQIMSKGGFDIVIGNPPYVVTQEKNYRYCNYESVSTRNLFAYMMERGIKQLRPNGSLGMIIPISSISGETMIPLQNYLLNKMNNLFISSYSTRPSKLFPKVEQRLSIIFGNKKENDNNPCTVNTTSYMKWFSNERDILFSKLVNYTPCFKENIKSGIIPKIGNAAENSILGKVRAKKTTLETLTNSNGEYELFYHGTPRYWIKSMNYLPRFYSENLGEKKSSEYKIVKFSNESKMKIFSCVLNSGLYYWMWNVVSDCRHLTKRDVLDFYFDWNCLSNGVRVNLEHLFNQLMLNYKANKEELTMNLGGKNGQVTIETVNHKASKPIIDMIDKELAAYYGFSDKELTFIQNFDFRFRMKDKGELDG